MRGNVMSACIAGIGSRKTPAHILDQMFEIGEWCKGNKWWVRSGHAPGADTAFELGAKNHTIVYLPWRGFNGPCHTKHVVYYDQIPNQVRIRVVNSIQKFHPNPTALTGPTRKLMGRNYLQVFGSQVKAMPVLAVVCWTPKGNGKGGTGQAIRIAKHHNIPVIDLGGLKKSRVSDRQVPWSTGEVLEELIALSSA